jgi:hypothetical protein
MAFLRRLFGKKTTAAPMRGASHVSQSQEQQDTTRATMEAELIAARELREGSARLVGWTEREQALIARVTQAFAGMMLEARSVDVHTAEGRLSPTLRFTVNESASTDLPRERIARSDESEEVLAEIVIAELRRQGSS